MIIIFQQQLSPNTFDLAVEWLDENLKADQVNAVFEAFISKFPPLSVFNKDISLQRYFSDQSGGVFNRKQSLEDLLFIWLGNTNPAAESLRELFDDRPLDQACQYTKVIVQLDQFFDYQPKFGPQDQQLIEMLRSPILASPYSFKGQLEYIATHWNSLLGDLISQLLIGIDLLEEEQQSRTGGPGPVVPYSFNPFGRTEASERFSPDSNWMPSLVLLAKNSYVWLSQLSNKYQTEIRRLDQIPDEELDRLAGQGITGLWLIGLWKRSRAS